MSKKTSQAIRQPWVKTIYIITYKIQQKITSQLSCLIDHFTLDEDGVFFTYI